MSLLNQFLLLFIAFLVFSNSSYLLAGGLQSRPSNSHYEPLPVLVHSAHEGIKEEGKQHQNDSSKDRLNRKKAFINAVQCGDLQWIQKHYTNSDMALFRQGEWSLAHFAAVEGELQILDFLKLHSQEVLFFQGVALEEGLISDSSLRTSIRAYQSSDNHHFRRLAIQGSVFQDILKNKTSSVLLRSSAMLWSKVTPLILALLHEQFEVVKYFLDNYPFIDPLIQDSRVTWLFPSRINASTHSFLMGSDPRNAVIGTLLWSLASYGQWELFDLLYQKSNASGIDPNLFYQIAQIGTLPQAEWKVFREKLYLEEKGVLMPNQTAEGWMNGSQEIEVCHRAAQTGDLKMLLKYLNRSDFNAEDYDQNGFQLVHSAAYHGQIRVLKTLREGRRVAHWTQPVASPSTFTILSRNYQGCTPLDLALLREKPSVVSYLLGVVLEEDPEKTSISSRFLGPAGNACQAYEGLSPLEWIAKKPQLWPILGKFLSVLPQDLILKTNPKNQQNFLHVIARQGFCLSPLPEELRRYIPQEALDARDSLDHRPQDLEIKSIDTPEMRELFITIKDGHPVPVVLRILENNPQLRKVHNTSGWGVVHTAAYFGRSELLVELKRKFPGLDFFEKTTAPLLTKKSSPVFLPTPAGLTPLNLVIHYAQEAKSIPILNFYKGAFPSRYASHLGYLDFAYSVSGKSWNLARKLSSLMDPEDIYQSHDLNGWNILHGFMTSYELSSDQIEHYLPVVFDPLLSDFRNHQGQTPVDSYMEQHPRPRPRVRTTWEGGIGPSSL